MRLFALEINYNTHIPQNTPMMSKIVKITKKNYKIGYYTDYIEMRNTSINFMEITKMQNRRKCVQTHLKGRGGEADSAHAVIKNGPKKRG